MASTNRLKRRLAQRVRGFLEFYSEGGESMAARLESLRAEGMRVGERVVIYESFLDPHYRELIEIGNDCTLTGVTILCHDDSTILFVRKASAAPVCIGSRVFIGRGAIVMPGITIGSDVIVGAGSVVTHDIPDNSVVAGNPARVLTTVRELCERKDKEGHLLPVLASSNLLTPPDIQRMVAAARSRFPSP